MSTFVKRSKQHEGLQFTTRALNLKPLIRKISHCAIPRSLQLNVQYPSDGNGPELEEEEAEHQSTSEKVIKKVMIVEPV